jgi:hypothetical protein
MEIAICAACRRPIDSQITTNALGKQWHIEVCMYIVEGMAGLPKLEKLIDVFLCFLFVLILSEAFEISDFCCLVLIFLLYSFYCTYNIGLSNHRA